MALTFVPAFANTESDVNLAKIDPELENKFIIYKRSNIIGKYNNLKPTKDNFKKITTSLDETINEYFRLE